MLCNRPDPPLNRVFASVLRVLPSTNHVVTFTLAAARSFAPGIALQGLAVASAGDSPGAGETGEANGKVAAGAAEAESSRSSVCPCEAETNVLRRAYGKESPINKYLGLPLSDFDEAFALLPQDANILDPRLMGPNFMNERVRLIMPAVPGGGGREGALDVLDEVLAMALLIGRQEEGVGRDRGVLRGGRHGRARAEGNLDPEAPLAQLFWQTLLPWNVFPTPSRPTPPPPRWL